MEKWQRYFKGKKITVMGLGLLGRGVGDTKFLAECGTKLIVTDLKTKERLRPSLIKLKKFHGIIYHLGGHRFEDFEKRDFILKSSDVPLDSPFIAHARAQGIPIMMSTALCAKLSGATLIGITGTRGKSTTTHLIFHMLKAAGRRVHLGGNVRGISTLALLKKIKPGDILILELDSWQLQGFGEMKISPHIAVFTNLLPDHMKYYKHNMARYFFDKSNIFRFQHKNDSTIAGATVAPRIKTKGTLIVPKPLPRFWSLKIPGAHNRENAACAVATVQLLGLKELEIKKGLSSFTGLPDRLELIRTIGGVKIYNDTTATTPDATRAGLQAFDTHKNIILIMGGHDKQLDMTSLTKIIPRHCKKVILLPGTGTDALSNQFRSNCAMASSLREAVQQAFQSTRRGDIILFSPAFASFGMFRNEFDRGEKFKTLVKKLK